LSILPYAGGAKLAWTRTLEFLKSRGSFVEPVRAIRLSGSGLASPSENRQAEQPAEKLLLSFFTSLRMTR